jgi:hypothetical protein
MSDCDNDWINEDYALPETGFATDIFSLPRLQRNTSETRNVQYIAHHRAPQTQPPLPPQPPPQAQLQPYVQSPATAPHPEGLASYVPALQNPGPPPQRVAWGNGPPMPNAQRQSSKLTSPFGSSRHGARTLGVTGRVAATQSNNKLTALQVQ